MNYYGSAVMEDRNENLCLLCGREVKGDADYCLECKNDSDNEGIEVGEVEEEF